MWLQHSTTGLPLTSDVTAIGSTLLDFILQRWPKGESRLIMWSLCGHYAIRDANPEFPLPLRKAP